VSFLALSQLTGDWIAADTEWNSHHVQQQNTYRQEHKHERGARGHAD
jgi:hypothetical protein